MTLYVGQSSNQVTPLSCEQGKLLFDESTRKEAYLAMKAKNVDDELRQKLERMYVDGSHQAGYFLGTMIAKELIPYPMPHTDDPNIQDSSSSSNEVSDSAVQPVWYEIE